MSQNQTVYIKLNQMTQVHKKDIFLNDIADVYCSDSNVQNRCRAAKIRTVREDVKKHYMGSIIDVTEIIGKIDPSIQVNSVGETDFIIAYEPAGPPSYVWEWTKTIFVCLVCFSGAAFAIMTFNNDVSVTDVFKEIYRLVMGKESSGFTALEASYSLGLAVGVGVFFNHFAKLKLNTDPTPLEVEMRLYEDNINKTLIQNDGRKESGVDVS